VTRRFLFAVWQGGGNVVIELALAKRLARRGHDVRVLGPPSLVARVPRECKVVGGDRVPEWVPQRGLLIEEQADEIARHLCGPEWRDAVAAELLHGPADVVVSDVQLSSATVAAEAVGTPGVLVLPFLFQPWYREWGNFALHDDTTADLCARAALTLVAAPAGLDFDAGELPANVLYSGPVSDPDPVAPFEPPWPEENDDPLVVVSFSTIYQRQEVALREVVEAVAELPVRAFLLAVDGLGVPSHGRVRSSGWVPHAAVMPRAALCVTHGGWGTVMSALASGVPLLVLPHMYEQALNGLRVSQLGAGALVPAEAGAAEIRASVLEVLGDPSFGAGARRASSWLNDGSERAVEALEAVARS
jgi:UDP:flavonoid glycosyltransferase YjiC (YdhE family)